MVYNPPYTPAFRSLHSLWSHLYKLLYQIIVRNILLSVIYEVCMLSVCMQILTLFSDDDTFR